MLLPSASSPAGFPEPTGNCHACRQSIFWSPATCPWCGALPPYQDVPLDLPGSFAQPRVSLRHLRRQGNPVTESTYLALGGGLGSFVWVDYLRICGAACAQIAVIGAEAHPHARFQRLCNHSQISGEQRIRSDSGARPDNIWGWPGYAAEEVVGLLRAHQWRAAVRILWQILSEPALAETYAPRAQAVYMSLEREMARIGWQQMLRQGRICALRQTDDGRYVAAYFPQNSQSLHFVVAPYVHLSLGYAGIHLTPELQTYRHAYHDFRLAVQAYEQHEHIYRQLAQHGGVLILRGRGIVASRILQRLDEIRQASGQPIQVIHLLRAPLTEDAVYGWARRHTRDHWQRQPLNWPKSAFGGDLRAALEAALPAERQTLLQAWGGVTTSDRRDWQEVVERGLREGWYTLHFGVVEQIKPNGRRRLVVHLRDQASPPASRRLVADFLIDCTGLNTALNAHPILADLRDRYRLPQNKMGQLVVTPDFELKELRNGGGQVFLAGVMALGNAFAPVDSFVGLQYAAQRTVSVLVREGAPNLRPLDARSSLSQWWRWQRHREPSP